MDNAHYYGLLAGYTVALTGWLGTRLVFPSLWPPPPRFAFSWRDVGWAALAMVGILALGQLYVRGIRLPRLLEAVNQLLIFSPLAVLLVLRRQPPETAWLPRDRVWARIAVGVVLACGAVATFTAVRGWGTLPALGSVWTPRHTGHLVQVFGEDVAIAILVVRLQATLGPRVTIGLVAALFAAAHVPALLATGATANELTRLFLDAALGVGVLAVLRRAGDVWWFWQVHFAMDMMQFHGAGKVG